MKNSSLAINIVLGIAVVVLYALFFTQGKATEEPVVEAPPQEEEKLPIAYVNSDSLLANYTMFKDMKATLEEKGKAMEANYQGRAKKLQKEFAEFQKSAPTLTNSQARALQQDLLKKEQSLRAYQEKLTKELLEEEAKLNKELYEKVADYLEGYGAEHGINMVVKYNRGSDVLFANSKMDITQTIIAGLNQNYQAANTATDSTKTAN